MPLTAKHFELLKNIRDEWNIAEQDIKIAEQVCANIIVPAIKELRYAGRRIVDAMLLVETDSETSNFQTLLEEAKFDCHRARHDAIDAATAKMAIDIDLRVQKLKYSAILTAFPDFPQLVAELEALKSKIAVSRGQRENREAIYAALETSTFPQIVAFYKRLLSCENMMKSIAASERRSHVVNSGGLIFGGIGVAISVVSIWLAYHPPALVASTPPLNPTISTPAAAQTQSDKAQSTESASKQPVAPKK